jgi:transposase
MARRFEMTDEQWTRIEQLLPGKPTDPGATAKDNRLFVDAVLWIARTGAGWRDPPVGFGDRNNAFQRFNRRAKSGVWAKVMEVLGGGADLKYLLIDSTVIRAHQHSAGAEKRGRSVVRPLAWRAEHQGPCRRRRPGQPGPADRHGRPSGRCESRGGVGLGHQSGACDCR